MRKEMLAMISSILKVAGISTCYRSSKMALSKLKKIFAHVKIVSIEHEGGVNEEKANLDIRGNNVLAVINIGYIVASYSTSECKELFYLCKVIDFGVAKSNLIHKFNHKIPKGSKHITCNYFQKC